MIQFLCLERKWYWMFVLMLARIGCITWHVVSSSNLQHSHYTWHKELISEQVNTDWAGHHLRGEGGTRECWWQLSSLWWEQLLIDNCLNMVLLHWELTALSRSYFVFWVPVAVFIKGLAGSSQWARRSHAHNSEKWAENLISYHQISTQ